MARSSPLLLITTCLLACGFGATARAAIPAIERAALIALYENTDGEKWANKTGWKTPPLAGDGFAMPGTECGWYLILCDSGESTIQGIDLGNNRLSGSIPPQLEDLGNLLFLYLEGNQLSGGIPAELGNLPWLIALSLYDNALTGGIPPELGDLANLEVLWLDGNDLTGSIPPALGSLVALDSLFLFDNRLSGSIPPQLGNLASVRTLFLNGNSLSGSIPPEIGGLGNLEELFFYSNQLTGSIPPELGTLAALRKLYLRDNRLNGTIPPELGNLSALTHIRIDHNSLVGPIPLELMDLVGLLDHASDFCSNYLYSDDAALSSFLDAKQIGGDWAGCQIAPAVPAIPDAGIALAYLLLAVSAAWTLRKSDRRGHGPTTRMPPVDRFPGALRR